jgi:hypothetical protein
VADASVATSTGEDVADLGPRVRGVVEKYDRATPKALPKPRKFTLDRGSAMIATTNALSNLTGNRPSCGRASVPDGESSSVRSFGANSVRSNE